MIIRGLCIDPLLFFVYSFQFLNLNLLAMDQKPSHHIYKDWEIICF